MARITDDPRYAVQAGACALSRWRGGADRCRWCDGPAAPGWPWCGNRCEDDYRANHWWTAARVAALRRDGHRCRRCGGAGVVDVALEVHHLVPRLGGGYGSGCHHHLANLETLCCHHHREVTRQQRAFAAT